MDERFHKRELTRPEEDCVDETIAIANRASHALTVCVCVRVQFTITTTTYMSLLLLWKQEKRCAYGFMYVYKKQ